MLTRHLLFVFILNLYLKGEVCMYSINDIKVTLLNPEEVKNFIKNHGVMACVCYDTDEKHG